MLKSGRCKSHGEALDLISRSEEGIKQRGLYEQTCKAQAEI